MIIFFRKDTGQVIGTVEGRVHSQHDIETAWIQPDNVPRELIGKYVVPVREVRDVIAEPILEWRIVDEVTRKVEQVQVGTQPKEVVKELLYDVPFVHALLEAEQGRLSLLNQKIITSESGDVVDIAPYT